MIGSIIQLMCERARDPVIVAGCASTPPPLQTSRATLATRSHAPRVSIEQVRTQEAVAASPVLPDTD